MDGSTSLKGGTFEQDDREQSPPVSITDMEQPPDHEPLNIMVLTKEFDPDLEELGKDFTSEENKDKRAPKGG